MCIAFVKADKVSQNSQQLYRLSTENQQIKESCFKYLQSANNQPHNCAVNLLIHEFSKQIHRHSVSKQISVKMDMTSNLLSFGSGMKVLFCRLMMDRNKGGQPNQRGQPNKRGQPPGGYKCRRCGSSSHFWTSQRCPGRDEFCDFCEIVGHYTKVCFWKKKYDADADEAQRRDDRDCPTTQNQKPPKKRPSSISDGTSAKRQKQQDNKADGVNVLPMASKQ